MVLIVIIALLFFGGIFFDVFILDSYLAKHDDSDAIICCVETNYLFQDKIIISSDSRYALVPEGNKLYIINLVRRNIENFPSSIAVVEAKRDDKFFQDNVINEYSSDSITLEDGFFESVSFSKDGKFINARVGGEILRWKMNSLGIDNIITSTRNTNSSYSFQSLQHGSLSFRRADDGVTSVIPARLKENDEWFISPYGDHLVINRLAKGYSQDEEKLFEIWDIRYRTLLKTFTLYSPYKIYTGSSFYSPDNKSLLFYQEGGMGANYIKIVDVP